MNDQTSDDTEARPQPSPAPRLLCAACLQAAADADALGKLAPPVLPAATIVQGMTLCNVAHRIVSQSAMAGSLLVPQSGRPPQFPPGVR